MAYQRGGYYDQHEMNYYDDSYHEDPGRQPHENPFAGGDLAESGGYYAQRPPLPQPPVQAQPQDTPYARGPSPPPVLVEQTSWESPYAHTNNAAAVDAQPYQEPNSLSSQPPFLNAPAHSSYGASSYALQDPGVVHPHTPAAAGEEGADEDPLLDNARYAGYNPTASASSSFPGSYPGGYAAGGVEDEHGNLVRYGKIPSRQPRRFKTVKRVELSNGNLVLDCPVPEKLLQMCTLRNEREFTHMRYTAATCDPDEFMHEKYTLRQVLYGPPRRTELFIVLTMYNEDEVLLTRTLHGVVKNIQHLCKRDRSKIWGKDGWKKVVVCIVSDGRKKIHSRSLSVLAAMGVYQDGVAKNVVNGKPVTAHIYEYTTQISIDPDMKPQGSEKGMVPVQLLFCLKEKNQKKINSHRWFFNAFGPILQPNVCVLLDVGTQPGPSSIYRLWKAFDINSNVAGACGEIVALKGKYYMNLINPLVASQNFEYKMSNILDKPTESVFGYISVLPGAFSAYRYIALQNDDKGHGPLSEYFKGETLHTDPNTDLWTKNMYLAEDRILCWELVSKRNSSWLLHYVRSAYAVTDVPDRLPELISQRRRWLNGSFFAAIHSYVHFGYLYRSSHSFARKVFLHLELVYSIFNTLFAWFGLANWYIAFEILTASLTDDSFNLPWAKYVNTVLHYIYLALLVMCFLLAMGNRPQGSNKTFTTAVVTFAIITCYMMFAAIFLAVKGIQNAKEAAEEDGGSFDGSDIFTNTIFRNIVLSLLATAGLYLVSSILFLDPWHMLTSFIQYLLTAPSFINVINVYAFCNVHDVSWGTKGDTHVETDLGVVKAGTDNAVDVNIPVDSKDIDDVYDDAWHVLRQKPPKQKDHVDPQTKVEDSYRNIRTNVVMAWAISNGALVAVILSTSASANISSNGSSAKVSGYMLFLLGSIVALALIRFIGSTVYLIGFLFTG